MSLYIGIYLLTAYYSGWLCNEEERSNLAEVFQRSVLHVPPAGPPTSDLPRAAPPQTSEQLHL